MFSKRRGDTPSSHVLRAIQAFHLHLGKVGMALLITAIPAIAFSAPIVKFQNVTTTCGVAAAFARGVAITDIDGDGDLDLFISEDTAPSHLFVNQGSGFFTDGAAAAGLALTNVGEPGEAVFWDFNNDDFPDLYVVSPGSAEKHMVNQGDGTFIDDAALAGLLAPGLTNSAVPLDYDRDGLLDLYIGQGRWESTMVHLLMRNLGNGQFQNVTAAAGLGQAFTGGGALVADFDNDGDPDLYIIHNGSKRFYRNNGNGTFTELTAIGLTDSGWGNGGAVGDYDNDGDLDILIVNSLQDHKLMRNNLKEAGLLTFSNVTTLAGLGTIIASPVDASFGDVDNDGDLDLYLSSNDPGNGNWRNYLFLNKGNGRFEDWTTSAGLVDSTYRDAHNCAFADLNGDGRLDIVVFYGGMVVMENVSTGVGHWLSVDLRGTVSNRDGIGARVTLRPLPSGATQIREKQGAKPRGTQDSPYLHFGLGSHSGPVKVTVEWPSGARDDYTIGSADRRVTLVEGRGIEHLPDLTVQSFDFSPNALNPSEPIRFSGAIANSGGVATSQGFWIELLARSVLRPTVPVYLCDSIVAQSLKAGESLDLSLYPRSVYQLPYDLYVVGVRVDPLNRIDEYDETNNIIWLSGKVLNVGHLVGARRWRDYR